MGGGSQSKVKNEKKQENLEDLKSNQEQINGKQIENRQTEDTFTNNNTNRDQQNGLTVSQDDNEDRLDNSKPGRIKRKKKSKIVSNHDIKNQFQKNIKNNPEKGFRIRESKTSFIQGDEFEDDESGIQKVQQSPTRAVRQRRHKNSSQFIINGQPFINKEEKEEMSEIKLIGGDKNSNTTQQYTNNQSFMSNISYQQNGVSSQQRYKRNSNKHLDDTNNFFTNTVTKSYQHKDSDEYDNFQKYSQSIDQNPNLLHIKQQQFSRQDIYSPVKLQRNRSRGSQYQDVDSPILPKTNSGLVGLKNIGNTCFMNSTLQCMFNLPIFNEIFLNNQYKKQVVSKNKGIAKNYAELLQKIRKKGNKGAETTVKLKSAIELQSAQFSGYSQQDAQELLVTLLQGLHEDLNLGKKPKYKELEADVKKQTLQQISDEWFEYNRQADNSHIQDYFCGQLLSKVICTKCKNESLAFDNYLDLSLSFSRAIRMVEDPQIERLFSWYLTEEQLEDEYYCSKCKNHRKCTRKFIIWKLPNILVIHLKRFHYGRTRREKINHRIKFPIKNLDLSSYVQESTDPTVKDCVYDLVGIVNHIGNLHGGHYIAECKNPNDKRWYCFNDSNVSEMDITQEEYEKQGSQAPYLLFYAKKSLLNANQNPLL